MSTQIYCIFDETQKDAALALNAGSDVRVEPRIVDNPFAGVGINLNADAVGVSAGDAVDLLTPQKWVAPARILSDPSYTAWYDSLGVLPRTILDSEIIFAPIPEDW